MPTRPSDLNLKARPRPPHPPPVDGGGSSPPLPSQVTLPGVCSSCEWMNWGVFESTGDEEHVWKSPERRAREASGVEQVFPFRCRVCGEVQMLPPDHPTGTRMR